MLVCPFFRQTRCRHLVNVQKSESVFDNTYLETPSGMYFQLNQILHLGTAKYETGSSSFPLTWMLVSDLRDGNNNSKTKNSSLAFKKVVLHNRFEDL